MKQILAFLLITGIYSPIFSQYTGNPTQLIINKVWQKSVGNPSNIDWSTSIMDYSNNFITIGNKIDNSGRMFVYLVKQNSSGVILWERTFSPQNNDSYGIGAISDLSGNIYVVAATKQPNFNYDYLVLKYDSFGSNIWSKIFDGDVGGDDIPTGITCNGNSVFVTGLSHGIGTLYDYWTLSINSIDGTSIWSQRYDYANLHDAPAYLKLDNLGFLIVTGVSAASSLNWELATLKYSHSGQLVSQNRISNNGIGMYLPTCLDTDDVGNIYVTGTQLSSPTNLDIKTIKINSSFTLDWQSLYDTPSSIDSSTVVKVDKLGNVVVAGYSKNSDGSKSGILIKYNNLGNIIWKQERAARTSTTEVIPRRMVTDNVGNIFVAYEVADSSESIIDLVQYDKYGSIRWVEKIELNENSINKPNGINLLNGDILLSAYNKNANGSMYFTCRLNPFIRPMALLHESPRIKLILRNKSEPASVFLSYEA